MAAIVTARFGYDIRAALKKAKTRPEYNQESLLLEVARRISDAMEEQNVSRAELARRLRVSPPYITKILRGHENFSLQTLARIAFALGRKWKLRLIKPASEEGVSSSSIRIRARLERSGMHSREEYLRRAY
jgi:transcriptional regulator with XRE-family HTH domain